MYVPRGTGRRACSPAAFVVVNTVSSALYFGIPMTGGKCRSVSLSTLQHVPEGVYQQRPVEGLNGTRRTLKSRRKIPCLRISTDSGRD